MHSSALECTWSAARSGVATKVCISPTVTIERLLHNGDTKAQPRLRPGAPGLKKGKKKRIKAAMKQVRCGECLDRDDGCPRPLKCAKKFGLKELAR